MECTIIPIFADKGTGAQRDGVTCLCLHSTELMNTGFELEQSVSRTGILETILSCLHAAKEDFCQILILKIILYEIKVRQE